MLLHPFSKEINKEFRNLSKKLHNEIFYSKVNNLLKESGCIYSGNNIESSIAKFYSQPFFLEILFQIIYKIKLIKLIIYF